MVEAPRFQDNQHKKVASSALRTGRLYPPGNIPGTHFCCGPESPVGIATGYGLDGPGIESRWGGEIFRTCPHRPCSPPSLLYSGYWVFAGVKSGRGVTLTPHPPSSAVVMNEYSYTSTPPMSRTACTVPQCLYRGDLYLFY